MYLSILITYIFLRPSFLLLCWPKSVEWSRKVKCSPRTTLIGLHQTELAGRSSRCFSATGTSHLPPRRSDLWLTWTNRAIPTACARSIISCRTWNASSFLLLGFISKSSQFESTFLTLVSLQILVFIVKLNFYLSTFVIVLIFNREYIVCGCFKIIDDYLLLIELGK